MFMSHRHHDQSRIRSGVLIGLFQIEQLVNYAYCILLTASGPKSALMERHNAETVSLFIVLPL